MPLLFQLKQAHEQKQINEKANKLTVVPTRFIIPNNFKMFFSFLSALKIVGNFGIVSKYFFAIIITIKPGT